MYAAVFCYGGVISHVEMDNDLNKLRNYILEEVDSFDPEDDTIQIWDNDGNIMFSYHEHVLGIEP